MGPWGPIPLLARGGEGPARWGAGGHARWLPWPAVPARWGAAGKAGTPASLCRCKGRWRRVHVGAWLAGYWSSPLLPKGAGVGSVLAGRVGARRGQGPWLVLKATCAPPSDQRTGGGRLGNERAGRRGTDCRSVEGLHGSLGLEVFPA
jgi:hypothetical protein